MKSKTPTYPFVENAISAANRSPTHVVVVKSKGGYKVISFFEWVNTNKAAVYEHNPLFSF